QARLPSGRVPEANSVVVARGGNRVAGRIPDVVGNMLWVAEAGVHHARVRGAHLKRLLSVPPASKHDQMALGMGHGETGTQGKVAEIRPLALPACDLAVRQRQHANVGANKVQQAPAIGTEVMFSALANVRVPVHKLGLRGCKLPDFQLPGSRITHGDEM